MKTMVIVTTLGVIGASATAQDYRNKDREKDRDKTTQRDSQRDGMKETAPLFLSGDAMRGMDAKNSAGDTVGSIKDLVVDRGSGEIAYVVFKSGTVLGMGGKDTVVGFDAFTFASDGKSVRLDVTADQVKSWPEFDMDRWKKTDRSEDSLPRVLATRYYTGTAPTVVMSEGKSPERVHGKITRITRRSDEGLPEEIVITLADGGKKHEVVLGPSWYIAGNHILLVRDADVDIETVRVTRAGDQVVYAKSIGMNNRVVPLYGSAGWPSWSGSAESEFVDTPFVLASEIDGRSVMARGEKCGEVENLVIDAGNQRIAFLAIDPSTMDDSHLVPWSVVTTIGKDAVVIDATHDQVVRSMKVPSELATLVNGDTYKGVYRSFDVNEPGTPRRRR